MGEISPAIVELGIVGLVLLVMWRLLAVMQMWWMSRDGRGGSMYMTRLACQTDPQHFERIITMSKTVKELAESKKENEPAMKLIREGVGSGAFGCTWTRDEVLRMVIAMEDNTKATVALTAEIRKQNGRPR